MQKFPHTHPPLHITLQCLMGRGGNPSLLSWDLAAVVTANSILSPAQSAGSACGNEVEAVPLVPLWGQTGTGEKGDHENSVMPL